MVVINLDTSDVHANRVFPMAYVAWVCVGDHTLPNKGTAHRALRGRDVDPPPQQVNAFLSCKYMFIFIYHQMYMIISPQHNPQKLGSTYALFGPTEKGFAPVIFGSVKL